MAHKSPMIGVVVSPELRQRLLAAQKKARRGSKSEFCALLLEYAVGKLEEVGSFDALDFSEGIDASAISGVLKRTNESVPSPEQNQSEVEDLFDAAEEGAELVTGPDPAKGGSHGAKGKGKGKRT